MTTETIEVAVARINGVALNTPQEELGVEQLRPRACTELLRQAAIGAGLLAAGPIPLEGAISEAAAQAIDDWLEQEIRIEMPADAACRRHFEAQPARSASGEAVQAGPDDLVEFTSVAGLPARAVRTPWLEKCLRLQPRLQSHAHLKPHCTMWFDCLAHCGLRDGNAAWGQFCPQGLEQGAAA
jgi:hypothetical protein